MNKKLVAAMRVKNEAWVIRYTLSALSEIVDAIVIYDDGSTDDTVSICKTFPKVVRLVENNPNRHEDDVDEAKDWNLITEMAREEGADWILYTDADEMIEPKIKQLLPDLLARNDVGMIRFRKISPWKRLGFYRTDSLRFDNKAENTLNPIIINASQNIKWDDGRGGLVKKIAKKLLRGENFKPSLGRGFPKGVKGKVLNKNDIVSVHFNHLSIDRLIRKQVFYALVEKRMKPKRTRDDLVQWVSKGWSEEGIELAEVPKEWYWTNYIHEVKYDGK